MTAEALALVAIIALTITAFAREWLPMDGVALCCLALLLVFGFVSAEEAVAGFGNSAVVTVLMMFVLSEGLVQSGVVTKIGYRIAEVSGTSHWRASILVLLLVGAISAVINNTAAVSLFMPVAIHLARHFRISPSKLLLPLSYTAIFGGTLTLIGTSTNLLVDSLARQHGGPGFTVFEFLGPGAVFFAIGLTYNILVPMRFLPPRRTLAGLTRQYHLSGFLTEVKIPRGSKLVGRTVLEERISERFQLNVLEVLRQDVKIASDLRHVDLRIDDILLVRGSMEDILAFKEQFGLLLLTDVKLSDADLSDDRTVLAEFQLSPSSELVGSSLKEIDFRRRYGCFVLALNRTGEALRDKITGIALRPWDTLLVFGPKVRVDALSDAEDFVPLGERGLKLGLSRNWWISAAILPVVVLLAASGVMSILKAAILGVAVLLLTRQITTQQAYRAIDWSVIFLLAAILPLGTAMQNTGLAAHLGGALGLLGANVGPLVLLSIFYLATSLLTEFFSNNATAVLMVPIAIAASATLGVDPKPFLMAICFAASASFMTPVGYQTNAMVCGPGNYRFLDYVKFGAPLNLIFWIVATFLIPAFWPL